MNFYKTAVWFLLFGLSALCAHASLSLGEHTLKVITVPEQASQNLRAATEDFAKIIHRLCDAQLSIQTTPTTQAAIHVGELPERIVLPPKTLETSATFAIVTDAGKLYIKGTSEDATIHGLYYFLQTYGGARWYQPGEDFEYLPKQAHWKLPQIEEVFTPDLVSVEFYALATPEEKRWAQRNMLRPIIGFHHNLHTLFTPEVMREHPSWKAQLDEPYKARYNLHNKSSQPDLLNPEVAAYAAQQAQLFFQKNENALSFPLGINDSLNFDTSPRSLEAVSPLTYFRNRPVFSNMVYTFMNRVAQNLPAYEPMRYLGCLAYFVCETPPKEKLHPQILPYLTLDSSMWHDTAWRERDQALMRSWRDSGAKHMGLYDYQNSTAYYVPHVRLKRQVQAMQYAQKLGYSGYFLELSPQWATDGPTPWILATLSRDASADIQALLEEYYQNLYGEAADPVRYFYETLEDAWEQNIGEPSWIKFFGHPAQANLLEERLIGLQALLNIAQRKELNTAQTDRLRKLHTALAFMQANCEIYEAYQQTLFSDKEAPRVFKNFAHALLRPYDPDAVWQARRAHRHSLDGSMEYFLKNPTLSPSDAVQEHSYARHSVPEIPHWNLKRMPDASTQISAHPEGGLTFRGCSQVALWQSARITPFIPCIVVMHASGELNNGAKVGLTLDFFNQQGQRLKSAQRKLFVPDEKLPEGAYFAIYANPPDTATQARVLVRIMGQEESSEFHVQSIDIKQ